MPKEPWIWQGGKILPAREATVSVLDHGFLYGDSIYETVRTFRGRLFDLEAHLERLERSANLLGLALPCSREELTGWIEETAAVAAPAEAGIRVTLSRGPGPLGIDPEPCRDPQILIYGWALPDGPHPARELGLRLAVATVRRNSPEALDPAIKSGNFLNNIQALREAHSRDFDDAILLTLEGHVAEGTTWNLFWRQGETLRTGVDRGILRGVTRGWVFEAAERLRIPVERGSFAAEDLFTAEEAFITSSIRGILPVRSIEDREFPVPGAMTARFLTEYDRTTQGE